jgi:hypothetical protein
MGLFMRSISVVFITAFALLLSACGGSGGGSDITQFTITQFTITSTSGDGGSISPASVMVEEDETTSFTLTPENNYIIDTLTGCEGSLSENTFTTSVINSDCNLSVTFKLKSYAVTTSAGQGGSISPITQEVIHGKTASFTLTPNADYAIDSVTGCDGSLDGNTYSTGIVTQDCAVSASFNLKSYVVAASAGQGGSISPEKQMVIHGETATLTLVPDTGYAIDSVTGCDGSLDGSLYTIASATQDCVVSASFNQTPIANAGSDQTVIENMTVTLDGSTSNDSEDDESGTPLLYRWDQTDATDIIVTLNDINLATPSFEAPSVTETTVLEFTLTVTDSNNDSGTDIVLITVNKNPPDTATGKLNDTGITTCSSGSSNGAPCPVDGYEGQDGDHGRDAQASASTLTKVGAGSAGFDFTKLDANGNALAAGALVWSCVQDNHTGLVWEVKTAATGLHYKFDKYTWYNTDADTNGGGEGLADSGDICYNYIGGDADSFCNTQAFVARVNSQSLCGATNWRLPNKNELSSIVDFVTLNPAIDRDYFPITNGSWYWSSSPYASDHYYAWFVGFNRGGASYDLKSSYEYVRLVRGGQ